MLDLIIAFLLVNQTNHNSEYQPRSENHRSNEQPVKSSGTRGCNEVLPEVTLWIPSMNIESSPSDKDWPIWVSIIDLDTNAQIFSWQTRTSSQMQQIPVPSSLEGDKQAIVVGIPCPSDPSAGQILETFINR